MPIIANNFLHFHSLDGVTIAERQENFFKLLHHSAPCFEDNPEMLDAVSANINPKTYLESYFKVEFFIYFRRSQELVEILKQGHAPFVNKIMKASWFFKDFFDEVSAENLVNDILPCMSFSVRMKVLKKLSRYSSCERFDQIFDAVVARYGIYLASQFVTGCSAEKIREILENYLMQLTSTQLRILYGKDSQMIDFYFSRNKNLVHNHRYLFKIIFNKDRVLFDHLKQKYQIAINLGRRTTKKYVTIKKDDIIQKPYDFHFLDMKSVIRKIGKDSVKLFTNALPIRVERCINKDWIFRAFPKKYHYSLFVKTFQSHYNINFENHPTLINETLLNIIPEQEERATLAKVKVDEGLDHYLKYLLVEDSIRLIKEKINLTSNIDERAKLIKILIETCHINNNIDALLSVMKYFCFRHKNDELSVHLQFIRNIENLFGFKQFNEEMWSTLNELLTIHMLKFDQNASIQRKVQTLPLFSFNIGTSNHQKLSYLEFLFKKGESIDELLKDYFSTTSEFFDYDKFDKNFGKYFLLFAINNFSNENCTKKDKCISFNCSLILQLDSWNKCYEYDPLSFYDFPTLLHTFNYMIRNETQDYPLFYDIVDDFYKNVFTTEQNIYKNEYSQIYFDRFDTIGDLADIRWFLKYEPLNIASHFDQVFDKLLSYQSDAERVLSTWSIIKKLSHLQLDKKFVQTCLTKLSDDSSIEKKPSFIPCLSVIMKPEEYAALADTYKPANKKLDLKNETEVRLYNLQCAIAKNFKNTRNFEVLPFLLNYCAGDYFKYAMRSLYSLSYHTPEEKLPQYLNYLSKQAVSVRKHALFLTCELSTSTKIENMIKILNKQEGVQSLQKHMFLTTIQYFVKNPSDQFFELIKLNMVFINKTDDESLRSIVNHLNKIPRKYKAQYIQYSWEFVEKTVEAWLKLRPLKDDLLSWLDGDILRELPLDFSLKILQDHFMTKDNFRDLRDMNSFAFTLLLCRDEKSIIFEKIYAIVDRCDKQSEIFGFLHSWYAKIMATKNTDLHFVEPFIGYYENKVYFVSHFHDFIKLFFVRLKVEIADDISVDEVATRILLFFEEVTGKCGTHVTHLFGPEMHSNLGYFTYKGYVKCEFYYSMIKQRHVPVIAALILTVLEKPDDKRHLPTFQKLMKEMKDLNDAGIDVIVFCKFGKYIGY